jgi:hypothetical protein
MKTSATWLPARYSQRHAIAVDHDGLAADVGSRRDEHGAAAGRELVDRGLDVVAITARDNRVAGASWLQG